MSGILHIIQNECLLKTLSNDSEPVPKWVTEGQEYINNNLQKAFIHKDNRILKYKKGLHYYEELK